MVYIMTQLNWHKFILGKDINGSLFDFCQNKPPYDSPIRNIISNDLLEKINKDYQKTKIFRILDDQVHDSIRWEMRMILDEYIN